MSDKMSRSEFIGHMHAYADSVEQDMARVAAQLEEGFLTEGEAEGIMARLRAEHETVTEMIAEFRKHL